MTEYQIGDKVKVISTFYANGNKIPVGTTGVVCMPEHPGFVNPNICVSFPSFKGSLHEGGDMRPLKGCEDKTCWWFPARHIKIDVLNWRKRLQTHAAPTKEVKK